MNIVCSDALGISCGTWIAFLNGGIGAFVAAVIGGVVALGVVRATAAQQAQLAKEGRSREATAQLVVAICDMQLLAPVGSDELLRIHTVADAAAFRWRIENEESELDTELALWPSHVFDLAMELIGEGEQETPRSDINKILVDAVTNFSETMIRWHNADSRERRNLVAKLRAKRESASLKSLGHTGDDAPMFVAEGRAQDDVAD